MDNFRNCTGGFYGNIPPKDQPSKITMGLTKEQLESLKKNAAFTLEISEEEFENALCMHLDENGNSLLILDDNGYLTCSKCKTKIKELDYYIDETIASVVDILETTKMKCLTLPPQTRIDFFCIISLIKKLPELLSGKSISINDEDRYKSYCPHRYEDRFAVFKDGDYLNCSICKNTFKEFEGSTDDVENVVCDVINIINAIKFKNSDSVKDYIRDLAYVILMLKKLPKLYERSTIDCKNALGLNNGFVPGYENSAFAVYQNMLNPMNHMINK